MKKQHDARRLMQAGRLAGLLMAAALTACVSETTNKVLEVTSDVQPRQATYVCGDGDRFTVENRRTTVKLIEADGESYDLPASPPSQTSRYGEGGFALVLEGREALWMKARHEPATCRR